MPVGGDDLMPRADLGDGVDGAAGWEIEFGGVVVAQGDGTLVSFVELKPIAREVACGALGVEALEPA